MLSRITPGEYRVEAHDARGDYVRICLVARSEKFECGYYVIAADDMESRREQAIADYRFYAAAPAIVRQLLTENKRAMTPSIVEALKLLDDAGYGAEVPNSLSDMIRKVLAERDTLLSEKKRLREQLKDTTHVNNEYGSRFARRE
jgi:hypothetical protein